MTVGAEEGDLSFEEIAVADALKRAIFEGNVNSRIGNWEIVNPEPESPHFIDLAYISNGREVALYAFDRSFAGKAIILHNYHRQAEKGNGTPSLISLERSLRLVARNTRRDIHLLFPAFGQTDTDSWLKKINIRAMKLSL